MNKNIHCNGTKLSLRCQSLRDFELLMLFFFFLPSSLIFYYRYSCKYLWTMYLESRFIFLLFFLFFLSFCNILIIASNFLKIRNYFLCLYKVIIAIRSIIFFLLRYRIRYYLYILCAIATLVHT